MATTVRVFALGGSILAPDQPDVQYAQAFASLLQERISRGEHALVVTGGGAPARRYIAAARQVGATEDELDLIGIDATRINARFLLTVIRHLVGPAVLIDVPRTIEDAVRLAQNHPIVVMGGTVPGHSTDYVAATLATAAGADHLYVLTNVDGVYSADPKTDPTAERLLQLTSAELVAIVGDPTWTAGRAGVVDPACARHVHESGMPVTVAEGRDLEALRSDLNGQTSAGSLVVPTPRQ